MIPTLKPARIIRPNFHRGFQRVNWPNIDPKNGEKIALPPPNKFFDLILVLAAAPGELPTSQVSRLSGAVTYQQKAVAQVKKI